MEWAHAHRKDKKATLAAAMETAFAKSRFPSARCHEGGPRRRARLGAARLSAPSTRELSTTARRGAARSGNPAFGPAILSTRHLRTNRSPADTSTPRREQPEPAADAQAPEGQASSAGDVERPAPPEPSNGAPAPETTGSPGVPDAEAIAPTGHDAIDAMNEAPAADGGPSVIVSTVGFENGGDGGTSPGAEPPAVPGNGHDTVDDTVCDSGGDALEIPAFLRRS